MKNDPAATSRPNQTDRAVRIAVGYERDSLRVLSRQTVSMRTPPSDPLQPGERESSFWFTVEDSSGNPLYRRVMDNPVRFDTETPTDDPKRPLQAPKPEALPPALNFAPLENAANALTEAAARYQKAAEAARSTIASNAATLRAVNARLMQAERQLTDDAGLPKRPWYRHLLYAPGYYTGYAVKTMPGVREAIEQKEYSQADGEIGRVAKALERETALLDSVSALLR